MYCQKKSFLGVRENYEIITALPWRHPPPSGRGGSERPSSRSLKLLTSDFSFCFLLFTRSLTWFVLVCFSFSTQKVLFLQRDPCFVLLDFQLISGSSLKEIIFKDSLFVLYSLRYHVVEVKATWSSCSALGNSTWNDSHWYRPLHHRPHHRPHHSLSPSSSSSWWR